MTYMYALAGVPFRGIPTSPFVQEVTMTAPDTVRVEVRDPLIQRGVIQYQGTPFPGTDEVWTTATNPVTGLIDNCMPLGANGYLFTRRFDDVIPTNWYNRQAGDVAANWGISGNLSITNVYRKSYPYCEGSPHFVNGIPKGSSNLYSQTASRHYLWLKLSGPLVSGTTYTITPPSGTGLSQITLAFNDTQTRASSILANQAGHRAGDELRLGYLSQYIPSAPNEGQINFASTYSISSFNVIDKNGTVVYTGSVTERGAPTTVEAGDNNSGNLRIYRSADPTRALPIIGVTFANPGVFTTTAPMTNGQIIALQGFGVGLQLTGMSWSSGTVTFTGPNNQSGNSYAVGNWFTISGASPSGYNGTFQAIAGTNSSQLVAAMAVNPGTSTVNGVMSSPAGGQSHLTDGSNGPVLSGNSSCFYVVANATSSAPYTFTLQKMSLPSGTAGADVSMVGLGPWGPGTFLTPAVAEAIGADTNFGVGFDSLIIPCYQANRAGTHVYGCDYSAATLSSSGSPYRIQIPGLGVSDPINVSEASWYDAAWNWMKGLYHQRARIIDGRFGFSRPDALTDGLNGTELFTSFMPMGFTGEDGGYVNSTSAFAEGYIALAPFIQAKRGPAGLGGAFHDSGDWPSVGWVHLPVIYTMLDMGYEFCGGTASSITAAKSTTFNYPKASATWGAMFTPIDGLSDAVHAALDIAEYYRLTQDQYGAVASGNSFGSSGFGDGGASELIPSSATAYAFALSAPEPVCNYYFALLAAKLAIIFYNAGITGSGSLSDIYATSAINAFNWAEGVRTGVMTDSEFYFGKTPYNGTALNIPSNSALANISLGGPVWTSSSTGTTVNGVGALGTITSSSDFTNGTYADVPLTGGSGTGAIATIYVTANKVNKVLVTRPGNNFVAVTDTLSCNLASIGGGTSFSVPVNSVVQTTTLDTTLTKPGQIYAIGTITGGSGGTPGTYTNVPLTTTGAGTGILATVTVGAGGNVTAVTITGAGIGSRYGDTLSANSANIGGVTGFSTSVKYVSDGSGGASNIGLSARTAAAGIIYRWYAITTQSLTSIQNIFIESAGKTLNDHGLWEIYNSPNNATPMAIVNSLNYPNQWTNEGNNWATNSADPTNAYYTENGAISSTFNLSWIIRGYIVRARLNGPTDSICVNIRKMMAAQLALTLGANPSGLCMPEGIGQRNTLGILHRDWQACTHLVTGFQPPPAGLTPYGWSQSVNASGFAEFSTDNPANWTVVLPTGINESTNGSKRIVNPHVQAMPMWEQCVENSGCITTMEFQDINQIISLLVPALTMWCWDGNTVKS